MKIMELHRFDGLFSKLRQLPAISLALIPGLLLTTGCASSLTGESYSRSEARKAQKVQFGIVEHVRPVQIEGTKTAVGPAAGAAIGGLAGSSVGSGTGSKMAAVAGAVAGGVAGGATEEAVTRTQGLEVTVRLESGSLIAVVQEVSNVTSFDIGDRVRVLTLDGVTRITH